MAMEKEGLIRCLEELEENNITDRHPSINKHMRENNPEVKHYFDVWHMAKGTCYNLYKKILRKSTPKYYDTDMILF